MIVRELITKLGFEIDESQLKQVDTALDAALQMPVMAAMDRVGQFFNQLSQGMMQFGKESVDAYGFIEQSRIGYQGLLGSVEKGNAIFEKLVKFDKETPFNLQQTMQAATGLLAMGETTDTLIDKMRMLGDLSMGNADKFQRIALVYNQIKTAGKLQGNDVLQLNSLGIPWRQAVSEIMFGTDKMVKQVEEAKSKGLVSFAIMEEAFLRMTSKGGRFFNQMSMGAQTFHGRLSSLQSSIFMLKGTIGEQIETALHLNHVLIWLAKTVDNIISYIEEAPYWLKATVVFLGAIVIAVTALVGGLTALAPLLMAITIIMTSWPAVIAAITAASTGFFAIAGVIAAVIAALIWLGLVIEDTYQWMNGGDSAMEGFLGSWKDFTDVMNGTTKASTGLLYVLKAIHDTLALILTPFELLYNTLQAIQGIRAWGDVLKLKTFGSIGIDEYATNKEDAALTRKSIQDDLNHANRSNSRMPLNYVDRTNGKPPATIQIGKIDIMGFNGSDESLRTLPPLVSKGVMDAIANYVADSLVVK